VTLADATWLIEAIAFFGLACCAGLLALEVVGASGTPPAKILNLPTEPFHQAPAEHKLAA